MDAGLADKTVLITGASGGIGRATAHAFAAERTSLVLHAHRNRAEVDRLLVELDTSCLAVQADLRDETQVDTMFTEFLRTVPRLDAIVVNAGIWIERAAPLHEMTIEQWRETVETDLTGAFLTCRAFFRHLADMRRDEASVVLVASTAALFGEEGHADYASAKAGMAYGLTLSLKNEIVRLAKGGRVNCLCPGWVKTPMTEESIENAGLVERVMSTMAVRKLADADDVARAIVFLTSPRLAGHISGAILPVTGGMEGRRLH